MNLDKRLLSQALSEGRPAGTRFDLVLTVGAGLLAGVLTVGQAYRLSGAVNRVFLEGQALKGIQVDLAMLALISLARAGLSWSSAVTAQRVANRVKIDLRQRLLAHLFKQGPAYVTGQRSGELSNTLVEGIEALDAFFSQYLPLMALAGLAPLTILAFVFPLDLVSGLVLTLTAPLIPIFMVLIGGLAENLAQRQWREMGWMSAHFLDMLQGLGTLKLLGQSQAQAQSIAQVTDRFRQATLDVLRVAFLSALVLEIVATLSTAIVAVEVGLRLLYARLSFEQAFFVLILAPEFYLPLRTLGARFHARTSALQAARRIFELLDVDTAGDASASSSSSSLPDLPASIRFEQVDYAYDGGQRPALRGVSFQIEAGQTTALVGSSGAGKSSLIHLLLRFIEPQGGHIEVGRQRLHSLPAASWRAQVAWLPQSPYLFNVSVADNIRLARPQADMADVIQAARQAHAHDFIQALPQGYHTPLGERGARLSKGQAQRIALARAFLRDAPILILDEAAANLDPQYEALIQAAIRRLADKRTVLLIAHRLSSIHAADQIVVLRDGQVVEMGAHQALMDRRAAYYRLVNAYTGRSQDAADRQQARLNHLPPAGQPAVPEAPLGKLLLPKPSAQLDELSDTLPLLQPGSWAAAGAPDPPARWGKSAVFFKLLRLAAPYSGWMALAALAGFATVSCGIGLMAASAFIIAAAALHPSIADLQVAIVAVRFFGLARGVFRYLERYVAHQATFRLLARLRVWFYQKIEPLAPAGLMHYRSGDLLARIVADIESLEHFYVRVTAPPLTALLVGTLALALMAHIAASLAAVLAFWGLLAGLGLPLLVSALASRPGHDLVTARSALNVALVDNIQGMADLLAFGQETRQMQQVQALGEALAAHQQRLASIAGLRSGLGDLTAYLAMLTILAIATPLVRAGQLDGVYLPALLLAGLACFEAAAPLPLAVQHLGICLEAAQRLFEIVDVSPSPANPPVSDDGQADAACSAGAACPAGAALAVNTVSFGYEAGAPPVLDQVSFTLPPAGRVAIVGPSGAGKSTLVHLLLCFWDYRSGQIYLAGRELRCYRPEEARRLIGVVSQDTYLFNASLRENLRLARPNASQADLEQAVCQAQLDAFVQALPEGYDTPIGERGLRLSGGERQRLAIARALIKDAPILILDEPTANLDAATEQAVLAAIQAAMQDRATLMVTHRLVGLETFDHILVLQAGRVVEQGRHTELLQKGGLYRRMWDLQTDFEVD